jgi:hypothetical protein
MRGAVLLLVLSLPAFAHHSISVDYDSTKPITLTGRVTRVEWQNPHAFFHIDEKSPRNDAERNWAIELGSLNSLTRMGWTRNSIRIGEVVAVQGIRAVGNRMMVNARSVTVVSTGERLLTWEGENRR